MAISATELETMRDALIRARAKGARELQMNGERVRYGSDAEMAAAIADLDTRLRAASGGRPSTIRFGASKGL
ncbi:phage head-tail joining protein [Thalassococcus sp. BH17M4-6]|uniref:phage head-tail joining protein n=1 Tax=Thalassococcus sp. BH17M4-6 TaxID=3413148 RepID=UPI003BC69CB8